MKTPTPMPIYLDHHATTPVDPRVAAVVLHAMTTAFGNANSVEHSYGKVAAALVADARCEVAKLLNADPKGVHFTSGSSESIRLALAHAVSKRRQRPLRVALTLVEHSAVLNAVVNHERAGEAIVRWLPVDRQARLNMEALKAACADGIDLVCVMAANNEVGTLYPIEDVARIATQAGAQTLVDATQAVGRLPIQATAWGITYLTVSAHKIYGPKGVGALIVPPELEVRLSHGSTPGTGDGTPNVPGIVGLGEACRLRRVEMTDDEPRMAAQRDRLESLLAAVIDGLVVNGDRENRLSNNLHVSVPGVPNDAVVTRLHRHVALSTGAACMSGAQTPSHVLRAMGLPDALQEGALRIGIGKFTKDEEIECAAEYIAQAVTATRLAMG
ncbi:MAG: cysteine desulfurase [Chloroflexi bacterium]|nr:cysteine desulfurase [Chloroflexota bacterium]MCI0647180.1 cysteine desulfurase [Chloroflexota bacterium]